jgi:hypothetical protein
MKKGYLELCSFVSSNKIAFILAIPQTQKPAEIFSYQYAIFALFFF